MRSDRFNCGSKTKYAWSYAWYPPAGRGFFSGDGRHRSKIGVSPRRVRPVLGSYDAARDVLTLVTVDRPEGTSEHVNSMWEIQKEPFAVAALPR